MSRWTDGQLPSCACASGGPVFLRHPGSHSHPAMSSQISGIPSAWANSRGQRSIRLLSRLVGLPMIARMSDKSLGVWVAASEMIRPSAAGKGMVRGPTLRVMLRSTASTSKGSVPSEISTSIPVSGDAEAQPGTGGQTPGHCWSVARGLPGWPSPSEWKTLNRQQDHRAYAGCQTRLSQEAGCDVADNDPLAIKVR